MQILTHVASKHVDAAKGRIGSPRLATALDHFANRLEERVCQVRLSPAVAKLAGIPEGRQAHGASMLGYAKHSYLAIPPRKPVQVNWV